MHRDWDILSVDTAAEFPLSRSEARQCSHAPWLFLRRPGQEGSSRTETHIFGSTFSQASRRGARACIPGFGPARPHPAGIARSRGTRRGEYPVIRTAAQAAPYTRRYPRPALYIYTRRRVPHGHGSGWAHVRVAMFVAARHCPPWRRAGYAGSLLHQQAQRLHGAVQAQCRLLVDAGLYSISRRNAGLGALTGGSARSECDRVRSSSSGGSVSSSRPDRGGGCRACSSQPDQHHRQRGLEIQTGECSHRVGRVDIQCYERTD